MLLWLDTNDHDMVILGDKSRFQRAGEQAERYAAWSSMHIDGICDLFGSDVVEAVRRLKHQPAGTAVDVQMVVLRVDGDDVSGCEVAAHQVASVRNASDNSDLVNVCQWMEDIGI
jgi:nitric oxide synthase oxygenase domain/subunit